MKENRIIWVDWAKMIGIMIVIFEHIPTESSMGKSFCFIFQMPLFFFLSGYLHKVPNTIRDSFKKNIKRLFIPYLLFQVIQYPYWWFKEMSNSGNVIMDFGGLVVPLLKSLISIPIDGPTWFIYSLLLVVIYYDFISKFVCKNTLIIISCAISIVLSVIINNGHLTSSMFTIDRTIDLFPFFILGIYVGNLKKSLICNRRATKYYLVFSITSLFVACLFVAYPSTEYSLERLYSYVISLLGISFIIYLCKCVHFINDIIVTLSTGTIAIMGLHWMFIGTTNFILQKILHLSHPIIYSAFEAIILVFMIMFVNYFIIIFCKKHFKILLGGR